MIIVVEDIAGALAIVEKEVLEAFAPVLVKILGLVDEQGVIMETIAYGRVGLEDGHDRQGHAVGVIVAGAIGQEILHHFTHGFRQCSFVIFQNTVAGHVLRQQAQIMQGAIQPLVEVRIIVAASGILPCLGAVTGPQHQFIDAREKARPAPGVHEAVFQVFADDSLGEGMEGLHRYGRDAVETGGDEIVHLAIERQEEHRLPFRCQAPGLLHGDPGLARARGALEADARFVVEEIEKVLLHQIGLAELLFLTHDGAVQRQGYGQCLAEEVDEPP